MKNFTWKRHIIEPLVPGSRASTRRIYACSVPLAYSIFILFRRDAFTHIKAFRHL